MMGVPEQTWIIWYKSAFGAWTGHWFRYVGHMRHVRAEKYCEELRQSGIIFFVEWSD